MCKTLPRGLRLVAPPPTRPNGQIQRTDPADRSSIQSHLRYLRRRRGRRRSHALRRESIRNSFAIQNVWKTVTLLHRMQRSYVFCSRENSKSVAATGRHRRYPWFRAIVAVSAIEPSSRGPFFSSSISLAFSSPHRTPGARAPLLLVAARSSQHSNQCRAPPPHTARRSHL